MYKMTFLRLRILQLKDTGTEDEVKRLQRTLFNLSFCVSDHLFTSSTTASSMSPNRVILKHVIQSHAHRRLEDGRSHMLSGSVVLLPFNGHGYIV